mgnify:CR=1 FL=1
MGADLKKRGGGRHKGKYAPMAQINVTPFVDVMLVLLIIFMVTAPLIATGVKVDTPQTSAKPLPQDDPRQRRPDISVADSRLGWKPKVCLEDGLKETIAYFRRLLDGKEVGPALIGASRIEPPRAVETPGLVDANAVH